MRAVLWLLQAVSIVGFIAAYYMENSFTLRAQKVQLVQIDSHNTSPFGPVTIDVGKPVEIVVDDHDAFLKNRTATGLPMVDIGYLKDHSSTLIKVDSIQSLAGIARIGCIVSCLVALFGLYMLSRISNLLIPADANGQDLHPGRP